MKEMNAQKVESFVAFLDSEIKYQREELAKLIGKGTTELAYECKLMKNQTEMIKRAFLKLLNDK